MNQNLLHGDWTHPQIVEILTRHPRRPLLPPLGSDEWRRVAGNPIVKQWLKPLRAIAEKETGEPMPELTDELYSEFSRTGVRLGFERPYFERRRRMVRAGLYLLLAEENDPWRERMRASWLEKLTSIFEEESWSLPAHVNWREGNTTGKDPMMIDLFCSETANTMAEMLDVFGALVPEDLRAGIRARLQTTIFENYLQRGWMWEETTSNWNAVCHEGVLGAALSQLDDAQLLGEMLMKARKHLPNFLNGMGADGGCTEGPGYWGYGFGFFAVLNQQLEKRTGGELSLFEGDAHVREIAQYGPRVLLANGNLVNFADGAATGGLNPATLSYLGERLNLPDCTAAAMEKYRMLAANGIDYHSQRSDFFHLGRIFTRCPETLPDAGETVLIKDSFFPDLGVVVARGIDGRGHRWDFAAKAGHNEEHHNHNDCGNFILNIDGARLVIDIGAPEYVRDFFILEKRYAFLAARTLGHSLPLINGCEQAVGRQYEARVLSHSLEEDAVSFSLEAAGCYPVEAGCESFVRTFRFEKNAGKLTVEDAFRLSKVEALESAVVAHSLIRIEGRDAIIDAGKVKLRMRPTAAKWNRVETHAYKDHKAEEAHIQRAVLKPDALVAEVALKIEFEVL